MLLVAASLDPRFKTLKHIKSENHTDIHESVITKALQTITSLSQTTAATNRCQQDSHLSAETSTQPEAAIDIEQSNNVNVTTSPSTSVLDNLFGDVFSSPQSVDIDIGEEVRREFYVYIKAPSVNINKDPLAWWAANSPKFPNLSIAAQHMLTIQSTSVASERIFSVAGQVVSSRRARLTPENVNIQMFLNKNLEKDEK